MNAYRPAFALCGLILAAVFAFAASDEVSNTAPAKLTVSNDPEPATQTASAKTNRTEITSKLLRMDTEKKIAYFDGDVLVSDSQFQLRANRLIVYLNPNGSGMDRAEALEEVVIIQEAEKRRAYSQKAVYTASDGKMVLTGNPRLESDKGATSGEVITIFRGNNTVLIEGGTRTIVDLGLSESLSKDTPAGENDKSPAPESDSK